VRLDEQGKDLVALDQTREDLIVLDVRAEVETSG